MGYHIELMELSDGSVSWLATDRERGKQVHGFAGCAVTAFHRAFGEAVTMRIDLPTPPPASGSGVLKRKERSGPRSRFFNLARRIQSAWENGYYGRHRYLVLLSRLWNHADHQRDSETFFDILTAQCPDAFVDPSDAGSMIFTYVK